MAQVTLPVHRTTFQGNNLQQNYALRDFNEYLSKIQKRSKRPSVYSAFRSEDDLDFAPVDINEKGPLPSRTLRRAGSRIIGSLRRISQYTSSRSVSSHNSDRSLNSHTAASQLHIKRSASQKTERSDKSLASHTAASQLQIKRSRSQKTALSRAPLAKCTFNCMAIRAPQVVCTDVSAFETICCHKRSRFCLEQPTLFEGCVAVLHVCA